MGLHVYHLALSALVPLSGGLLQWCLPVVGRNCLMGAPWMSHVTMNPASGRLLLGWAIPLSWGKNLPNSVVWGVWTSGNRPKSWAERCCSCFGRTADACRVLHGRHGLFFVASTVWSWQKSIPQNWKKQVPPKNEQNSRVILPRDPKILHACWSHWFTRETLGLPALRPSSFEGPVGTFNLWQGLLGLAQDGACIYITKASRRPGLEYRYKRSEANLI